MAVLQLRNTGGDSEPVVNLTGCYHNLLRMWLRFKRAAKLSASGGAGTVSHGSRAAAAAGCAGIVYTFRHRQPALKASQTTRQ
ncbi:hypothetical protein [Methylomonas koyamae]|uniref:hypothetical protein n=1 Tax=Methylomonas koyamae TaxID=702114 RepID=UPI00210FD9C1|nr:hypothetical protein [Methylomonas koyamae]